MTTVQVENARRRNSRLACDTPKLLYFNFQWIFYLFQMHLSQPFRNVHLWVVFAKRQSIISVASCAFHLLLWMQWKKHDVYQS